MKIYEMAVHKPVIVTIVLISLLALGTRQSVLQTLNPNLVHSAPRTLFTTSERWDATGN